MGDIVKNKLKSLRTLALVLMMTIATTVMAFAATSSDIQDYASKYDSTSEEIGHLSKYFADSASATTFVITTKDGVVYHMEEADVDAAVKRLDAFKQVTDTPGVFSDMPDVFNWTPDWITAAVILGPLQGFVATLVGIAVIGITLLMTLNTAFDIAYIAFPVIRNKMIDSKNSGGAMAHKNADGSTSLRIVTDEAQFAVEQVTNGQGKGGNAMSIYFKKRIVSYIILSIMLFILLTGNISLITNLAVKAVSGLLSVLTDIAT